MLRALIFPLLLFSFGAAHAHKPSDSYLTINAEGQRLSGQWDIALRDLDFALGLDQDGDSELTWDEIRGQHSAIAAYALARLALANRNGVCTLRAGQQLIDHHTDGAYAVLRFDAACPGPVDALSIGYTLFAEIDPQHKGLARIGHRGQVSTAIFSPDKARQTLSLEQPSRLDQFADYVKHGVWHIWIGFDHILFLLSLLLPAVIMARSTDAVRTMREAFIDVLKVVTAFTLAHSLTLTLASLQVLALPARWVESAIAASVALAALNNIVPLFRGRRPLAAFVFGLIHGFGFASVLAGLGLPQGAMVLSLFGFNAGVELGQLAIVAVFLPLAFVARRTWLYRQVLTAGSALIALVAAAWFVERAFDVQVIAALT
jgi:hypothetical protein